MVHKTIDHEKIESILFFNNKENCEFICGLVKFQNVLYPKQNAVNATT